MESPRSSVSAMVRVAGLGGGGTGGPENTQAGARSVAGDAWLATGSLAVCRTVFGSASGKDTSFGSAADTGIAAERWERIPKRSTTSTSRPRRLPQNQIEGSNREFKERPRGKKGIQRLGTVDQQSLKLFIYNKSMPIKRQGLLR